MPDQKHYTKEQIASALIKSFGIKFKAARMLGCVRQTVDNYIERYPELEQVIHQAKEARIDLFEEQQLKLVVEGYWPAIDRGLRGLGKSRGWSEKPIIQVDVDNRRFLVNIEEIRLALGDETDGDVLTGLLDVVEGEIVNERDDLP